jgi:membrane-associated phospholipid phosphatase
VLTVGVAVHPEPFPVDLAAARVAEDVRTAWLTAVLTWVTRIGSSPWLVAILIVVGVVALVVRRDPRPGAWLAAEYLGAVVMYQTLKAILDRPRPPGALVDATGSAFPSGHATQGIAFFGMLAVFLVALLPRRVGPSAAVAMVILGVLSGLSRVYLGVHWLTDVAGGFLLGGAWLAALLGIRAKVERTGGLTPERDGGSPLTEPPPPDHPPVDTNP